jgi:hypothetical protein
MSDTTSLTDLPVPRVLPFQSEPGRPYRPTSGEEGRIFEARFCAGCAGDHAVHADQDYENGCAILAAALAFDIDEKFYPVEWVIAADGYPTCTAFDPDGCS